MATEQIQLLRPHNCLEQLLLNTKLQMQITNQNQISHYTTIVK